jgi:hypothetical protein
MHFRHFVGSRCDRRSYNNSVLAIIYLLPIFYHFQLPACINSSSVHTQTGLQDNPCSTPGQLSGQFFKFITTNLKRSKAWFWCITMVLNHKWQWHIGLFFKFVSCFQITCHCCLVFVASPCQLLASLTFLSIFIGIGLCSLLQCLTCHINVALTCCHHHYHNKCNSIATI